jgi:hypothetical protein
MKQKVDDINNEFLIMWMGKVTKFKALPEFLHGNQKKPRKPSVNVFGVLIELRDNHLLNTGQK